MNVIAVPRDAVTPWGVGFLSFYIQTIRPDPGIAPLYIQGIESGIRGGSGASTVRETFYIQTCQSTDSCRT